MLGDPFIPTNEVITKVCIVATGYKTPRSIVATIHHPVCKPAQTVDIVPGLRDQSLTSGEKLYVTICSNKEVNIYNDHTIKIIVSGASVLKGW
jgi:hypothetical protein